MTRILAFFACGMLTSQIANAGEGVDYATQIKPILSARCYACHSALRKKSGLRVDTAAALVQGGDAGAAIQPEKASESYLIEMLTGASGTRMPPEEEGAALTDEQIALIKKWIDEGAHAPREVPQPDPRDHWSYQVPRRPGVPHVENAAWGRNPIDAFIAAGQESHGLTPVGAADKATLLRRVYLDLVGLPPTRKELAAFVASESPNAYEEVVDELLARPQYGERWARHWMDVWRYSDWFGYREEIRNSARHIWRWRDWIVESLNADKGYDRMAMEMLAGDELAPANADTLRATGYLVRNWYKFDRNVWLESTVEHTAKAFLGVTMNCCRCHDHKFDPIDQVDYYRFRAIFEPHDVHTERVPGQPDVAQDGLPRAYDSKSDAPTYVFERGDYTRPLKEEKIAPGVAEILGPPLDVKSLDLPVPAYYPALAEFALREDLARANDQVVAAESALAKARVAVAGANGQPADAAPQGAAVAQAKKDGDGSADAVKAAKGGDKNMAADKEQSARELVVSVAAAELAARKVATARASVASLTARVAADKAKYGLAPDADAAQLALVAATAEQELAFCQAQEQEMATAQELAVAKALPPSKANNDRRQTAEKSGEEAAKALAAAHAAMTKPSSSYKPLGEVLPSESTGRRLAFAKWLVDRRNPLAARVAVNHIWQRHFGAPLVESMFDFGIRAPTPRHQALLDWLAVELMDHGWQMKHIHRLIVTSNTYRLSSSSLGATAATRERDRDNHYLWRMNTRRMEAELVRDSVFFTAGKLDLSRGGPEIAFKLAPETPRRSLYFQHAHEKQNRMFELFDSASVNECYRRSESIVPQQALALANSDIAVNNSRILAKKLGEEANSDANPQDAFLRLAFEQVLSRRPTSAEFAECQKFLDSQAELLRDPSTLTAVAGGAKAAAPPAADPKQRARENLVLVLFNHNDFITIR